MPSRYLFLTNALTGKALLVATDAIVAIYEPNLPEADDLHGKTAIETGLGSYFAEESIAQVVEAMGLKNG